MRWWRHHVIRAAYATLLLSIVLVACRLDGMAPSSSALQPASPASPADSAATPATEFGISRKEAIDIASDFRSDPDTTVLENAAAGAFGEVVPPMDNELISADREVWVVTFSGDYNIGCDVTECPKQGTENIIIDFRSGEVLMSQTYSPEG
jgi:hypothetical protein